MEPFVHLQVPLHQKLHITSITGEVLTHMRLVILLLGKIFIKIKNLLYSNNEIKLPSVNLANSKHIF